MHSPARRGELGEWSIAGRVVSCGSGETGDGGGAGGVEQEVSCGLAPPVVPVAVLGGDEPQLADDALAHLRQGLDLEHGARHHVLLAHARSEEHTSELQSLMRISYAVFCLNKQTQTSTHARH